jgi:hypothetical protein
MRLILHTLKKDARRLWPAAAGTSVMLATLAAVDGWRADWMASPMEGWLTLLLTMAWGMLAALAVLEEPLVGDTHFWTTRPHRWPELLAAKLIFVVLAIHLPSLVADVYVLAAREFRPLDYVVPLLWKQLLFFGAVTLPCIALASLVRNFTHFVIAVFAIAAGIAILNGGFGGFPDFRRQTSEVRYAAIRILLAGSAVAVIWTQYARRRVLPARVMAVAAMLTAASVSAWFPARAGYAVMSRGAKETPRISLRPSPTEAVAEMSARMPGARPAVLLPIAIAPGAPGALVRISFLEVEIVGPNAQRLRSIVPSPNRPFQKIDLTAFTFAGAKDLGRVSEQKFFRLPDWLALQFSSPSWERFRNARVRVRGIAAFDIYQEGASVVLPSQGSRDVSGIGRCTVTSVDDRFSEQMLKVLCESPREPPAASIRLRHDPSGRDSVV